MTSTTDANGTVSGASYDGFGRQTLSKVTQPGGSEGILLSTSYAGFELNSPVGRSIVQKIFPDAVASVTAPGRISTRAAGALGTRHSLRPLIFEGETFAQLGRIVPRDGRLISSRMRGPPLGSVRASFDHG
jgi:YD repeat-containing protein